MLRIGLGEGKRKSGSQAFFSFAKLPAELFSSPPRGERKRRKKKLIKPKKGKFKKKNSKFHVKPKAKHVLRHARSSL